MKRIVLLCLLLYPALLLADVYTLTHEQWSVPRSAQVILEMPAIRSVVNDFNQVEHGRIRLQYPGGDTGNLWIHELKSWLVALGVPEHRIETIPGTENKLTIKLEVIE